MECYLPGPVEQGGCGGDMRTLCTLVFSAIMDHQAGSPRDFLSNRSLKRSGQRIPDTGSCLPDILARLQELVYEMQLSGHRGREEVCHFLFELLSVRCSSSGTSDSECISRELRLQQTLHAWNRVLLALPAELFVVVRNADERWTVDFTSSIEHVNGYQKRLCSPAAVLPYHVTSHLLRGMLSASARCARSSLAEVNRAWSEIPLRCPLLLVSTVRWWGRLSPMLSSVWQRLRDEDSLPELLRTITACVHWAQRSQQAPLSLPPPAAPALLLAASLHLAWGGQGAPRGKRSQAFRETLETLGHHRDEHGTQVLVFLLFISVTDMLSSILYPEEACGQGCKDMSRDVLPLLLNSPDWHVVFKTPPTDQGPYQAVTMATLDEYNRLRPLAFYSLLPEQHPELLKRALGCPGFLHTAVLCYAALFQLFLDGHTPHPITEPHMEPSQILGQARQFLLSAISQSPPTALSSTQLSQLESLCAELDPEVAAALTTHLDPHSLSQEMEFL
ncbi:hypothetical protein CRUP_007563 [Coryphaenoides rupestris]|nr:hypothetical protein CRUP_007563 [Coryphaenoides rupestris]